MTNVVLLCQIPNKSGHKTCNQNKATKNSLISQSESTEQYYKIHILLKHLKE